MVRIIGIITVVRLWMAVELECWVCRACSHAWSRPVGKGAGGVAGTELVEDPPCKKCGVTTKTVDKWIAENIKVLNTTM